MEHLHCGDNWNSVQRCICEEMVLGDWESDRVGVFGKRNSTDGVNVVEFTEAKQIQVIYTKWSKSVDNKRSNLLIDGYEGI